VRRLTALLSAASVMVLGSAAAEPGQLGDAARLGTPELLPLAGGPAVHGVVGDGVLSQKLRTAAEKAEVVPHGVGPHLGAQVLRRTALRSSPGGSIVVDIGHRTRFGGPQILAVVARRGRWLGVLHQWMPNGRAGWIDASDAQLLRQPWAIEVDRSDRTARVRLNGRVVDRFPVGIGRAGSETPLGRFAVTDRLVAGPGSPYGCCILALSGTQPNLPSGWSGGDRLALHGSVGDRVGGATSAGCLNLRETDLHRLMRRIPVGARVTVRA
jgi:hypothetical protein